MSPHDKPLRWLLIEVRSPPLSEAARIEVGHLIRRVQRGEILPMPLSRPMPVIGAHCHELRVRDEDHSWRLIYRIDADAIILVELFDKNSEKTPKRVIEKCRQKLNRHDRSSEIRAVRIQNGPV